MTKKAKSSRGYSCMQIFVSDKDYVYVSKMKSVREPPKALKMFSKEVGVPEAFISDSHKCYKSKAAGQFFTIMVRHFEYWKESLNAEIELRSMLIFSNNPFVKICVMKIHP